MVQFIMLPESTQGQYNRQLGQAFSEGMAKNLPDPRMQQVGRQQQGALEEFKQSLAQTDKPADVSMKWAEAMAGVPGSEQLQQSVLPQYQLQAMANLYQQPPGAGQVGIQQQPQDQAAPPAQQPGVVPQQPAPTPGLAQLLPGMPAAQGIQGAVPPAGMPAGTPNVVPQQQGAPPQTMGAQQRQGFDPGIMQMSVMTGRPYEELARMYRGVPEEQIQSELQNIQLAKAQELANYAENKLPGVDQDELNDFMRIGAKYQGMSPEDWFKATKRDFTKFQNVKANFDNANIPGMLSGIVRGGKYREDQLKRLENLSKPLVDLGYEDYVRSKMVDQGLSPTEAEMIIKPLEKTALKSFKGLPQSPYMERDEFFSEMFATPDKPTYDQLQDSNPAMVDQMTDKYAEFLKDNVSPDVSLLGLREKLRREKGLDWRHYQESLNRAMEKGLSLNAEQQGELGELTNAPRDSLVWIFQDWGRWTDYLRGKK